MIIMKLFHYHISGTNYLSKQAQINDETGVPVAHKGILEI